MEEKIKKEIEMEKIKTRANLLFKIIFERYKTLPLISTLLVALLVISAISEKLIKNFLFFKTSLIILLLLIPISIFAFLASLKKEEGAIARRIRDPNHKSGIKKDFFSSLLLWSPWIITGVLTIAIFWFILSLFIS